ncbi:MAG: 50S ribosomal protein L18e [Nanoarchaeota archaeon]|nr:50S ribosomal protein L18e [Nanoarchaeota archaeon]
MRRKTNVELVGTILSAKKADKWVKISHLISVPTRKQSKINLEEIDKNSQEGETILVPGKVLGVGDVSKKIRVVALKFSESAIKKLKDKKCEIVSVKEEIKVNPLAKGIKIIK